MPGAEVEEMLPAAQLMSRRAAAAGDYIRAKAVFLQGVKEAQVRGLGCAVPPLRFRVGLC